MWTDSEVIELVEELKTIKNEAINEAVKEAVIPLIAEKDVLAEENIILKEIITEQDNKIFWSCVGIGIFSTGVGFFIGWFVQTLIPPSQGYVLKPGEVFPIYF